MEWSLPAPSLAVYVSPDLTSTTGYLAIFDLDSTLVYSKKAFVRGGRGDFGFLPGRLEKLKELYDDEYSIIIVTNQKVRSEKEKNSRLERIEEIVEAIGLPLSVYVALGDDKYRKPKPGIWKEILITYGQPIEAFFVGDADGQPGSHSDVDIGWAHNVGIPFYPVRDYFARRLPKLPEGQKIILMMGAPGSGKSTLAEILATKYDLVHLEQDEIGNAGKTLTATKRELTAGNSVVIDATHATEKSRQPYIDLAQKNEISIYIFWVVRDGMASNKEREKPVPMVAINTYFARLEPPNAEFVDGVFVYDFWK